MLKHNKNGNIDLIQELRQVLPKLSGTKIFKKCYHLMLVVKQKFNMTCIVFICGVNFIRQMLNHCCFKTSWDNMLNNAFN